jgi:hypothetical protein
LAWLAASASVRAFAVVDQRLDQLGAADLERLLGGARLRLVAGRS